MVTIKFYHKQNILNENLTLYDIDSLWKVVRLFTKLQLRFDFLLLFSSEYIPGCLSFV